MLTTKPFILGLSTISVAVGGLMSTDAWSQDVDVLLEEIVVSARKTEESLADVPLSITAFSAEAIEDAAIDDLNDVADFTPGLTFNALYGEFLPVPVIRGLSPTDVLETENNAGVFVDGIFISGQEGLNFSQLDIERIEVVKGPQSALYGRNTFSGAINIVTKKPTDEFEGKVELTMGDGSRRAVKASVSGPLVPGKLAGRIAAGFDEWDGSYNNQLSETTIGGYGYVTANGSLTFTPNDNTDITAMVYWSDDEIDAPAMNPLPANCEPGPTGAPQNFCGEIPSVGVNDLGVIADAVGERRNLLRANLSVNWTAEGGGTLSWLTGHSNTRHKSRETQSRGGLNTYVYSDFLTGGTSTFQAGVLQPDFGVDTDELSSELRWTSPDDQRVRYSVGGYYYNVETDERDSAVVAITAPPFGFVGFCPCVQVPGLPFPIPVVPPFATDFLGLFSTVLGQPPSGLALLDPDSLTTDETDAWAAFAYVEADFTEQLTGRVEVRYADEEKSQFDNVGGPSFSDTWDFTTYRVSLDYKLNDDWMIYADVATGSKSGGFDTELVQDWEGANEFLGANLTGPGFLTQRYEPEENTSFEVGAKGTLVDGRYYTDFAVYFIDWTDIVLPQIEDRLTPTETFSVNAGDASVLGVEWSLQAAFTERLTGQFGLSWTDAEFDNAAKASFDDFPSFAPDGDISGQKLLRQSKEQANASLTYTAPAGPGWEWYIRGDVIHRGESFVGEPNQAIVPERTTANLRLGFESDQWELVLWSENVTDDDTPIAAFRDPFFANTVDGSFVTFPVWRLTVSHPRRRTVGATVRVRF